MVWQNCPVSWKFWFPGVISLTMDCCSTQSKITPCNAALENHFELPNWSLKVVLHRPFLILRPMQNLVYFHFYPSLRYLHSKTDATICICIIRVTLSKKKLTQCQSSPRGISSGNYNQYCNRIYTLNKKRNKFNFTIFSVFFFTK